MTRPLSIRTLRLVLRDWQGSDLKDAYEYGSDPRVVRFMPWGPNTLEQSRVFIRRCLRKRRLKPRRTYEFAVVLAADNKVIGGCGIRIKNAALREGDLGYCFNLNYWGQGYATEAAQSLIHFGFTKLKLHRLRATCDNQNKASARVLEKVGLRFEGLMRENLLQKGKWRDSRLYAMLDKDFGKTEK